MIGPTMKEPAPWTYQPTGPFFLVTLGVGLPAADEPFTSFNEVLDLWVRYCMMPERGRYTGIILDNDGVCVIGWMYVGDDLVWLGIDWAWRRLDGYSCLRPITIEEARMQVKQSLGMEVGV